jgi:alpha-beta hydrolase superfamily lysophospholipase
MRAYVAPLALALLLAGCADGLFYHPDQTQYATPAQFHQEYEDVYFTSHDGTRLHGWFVPAVGKPKATIVQFHGNAENISAHYSFVAWLPQAGYNVFTFDYRGYGLSQGSPDRKGIHDDALAALDYIAARKDAGTANLVILGQSLGGAVGIVAAAEHKQDLRAVIIESTFSSYRGIAHDKAEEMPVLGSIMESVLRPSAGYDPADYVGRISPVPLLLLHGTADPVIPIAHSELLYEKAGSPRQLVVLQGGRHIEAFSRFLPKTGPLVLHFLDEALASGGIPGAKPAIKDGIITVSP